MTLNGMRIADIEVLNLRANYPDHLKFRYSGGVCTGRLTSLVKVTTESGIVGWGTTYSFPKLVDIIITEHLKPFLIGKDPSKIGEIWDLMYKLTRWYGRKGVAISALGAVDIALWDLQGKAVGKPLYQLLDSERSSIPAYASALFWKDDVSELEVEARNHIENGYGGVKMRLGRGQSYDVSALEAVRRGVGPDGKIMVDGSQRYTFETAEWLGKRLSSMDIVFFQEPFPPEEIDQFVRLRNKLNIPLAAGENEFGVQGFQEIIRMGALDILQPDVCRSGGITEVLRIGQLAAEEKLPIMTHTWSDAVAIIANAHVVAALPTGKMVEVDQTGNPFVDDLLTEPLNIHDGYLQLPDSPGLGVEPDPDKLARFSVPGDEVIPPGLYSDLIFGPEYLTTPTPYVMDDIHL